MKVKELIAKLSEQDPDAEVLVPLRTKREGDQLLRLEVVYLAKSEVEDWERRKQEYRKHVGDTSDIGARFNYMAEAEHKSYLSRVNSFKGSDGFTVSERFSIKAIVLAS